MNIKSLLIGSAAACVAVSGAHAADAIVAAEPEPVEYVRVCDAFGTGYFYIPGTETCLKIGGYVRFDVRGGENLGLDTNDDDEGDEWDTRSRFVLRTSTASDTELGALKTFTETRINYRNNGTDIELRHAYIDLAGFRVGQTESGFITFTGNAGNVLIDDWIDWGTDTANVIQYNYDSGTGFTALISLEDTPSLSYSPKEDRDYVPNVVGGLGYETDSFEARIVAGYDSAVEEAAIKGRLDASFGSFEAFVMAGWNTDGDRRNAYATWFGDWAVWGGFTVPVAEKAKINTQIAYTEAEDFAANINVALTVVPGFVVTPELVYTDNFDLPGDQSQWGGIVRFQRSF
ncbi:MAG: porin [Shinella sp.]|nr:porin [Shinella sp.]